MDSATTPADLGFPRQKRIKTMNFKCFFVVAALASTVSAHAGPFGLEMGMSKAQLDKLAVLKPTASFGGYAINNLPGGHPQFDKYLVKVTPKEGLCKLIGFVNNVRTASHGTQLKAEFERLHDALTLKYGKGDLQSELEEGSIWDEPRDWMMALLKEERVLRAVWSDNLPDNIASIALSVSALGTNNGSINLSYDFKNIVACIAAGNAKKSERL